MSDYLVPLAGAPQTRTLTEWNLATYEGPGLLEVGIGAIDDTLGWVCSPINKKGSNISLDLSAGSVTVLEFKTSVDCRAHQR
jgi:hypothetical protein